MEYIREEEEQQQKKMEDPEGGRDEALQGNAQEELAKMASSLMAAVQSQQHKEEEEEDDDDDEEISSSSSIPVAVPAVKPLVKRARKLLFRRLRVGVEDGRVFVGKFHCLDKQGNIILYDTVEFRQNSPPTSSSGAPVAASAAEDSMEQRSLGLVLIPARCRTSLFVECSLHEQFSLLSV